jgi:hypothetical protein
VIAPAEATGAGWLLLFDIDGTLLRCGREVGTAFFEALAEVFGADAAYRAREAAPGYSFAGRTDPRIVIDLMGAAGVSRDEAMAELCAVRTVYLERLAEHFDGSRTRVFPGVDARNFTRRSACRAVSASGWTLAATNLARPLVFWALTKHRAIDVAV